MHMLSVQLNEGTTFAGTLRNLNLTREAQITAFDDFIRGSVIDESKITSDVLERIHQLYPASPPSLPHATGDELFDRAATWYSDSTFLAARRMFVDNAVRKQDVWVYHFRQLIPGNDPNLGVYHASELPLLFGPVPDIELDFANIYLDFYINFINDLNPGGMLLSS